MPKDIDAIVAGCIGIDTCVYLYGEDIDFTVEANFSQNVDAIGQAGGYSTRGFAALGRRTAFIGTVGQDWHGQYIRQELAREGVHALLFDDPLGTHRSINFMYRDGRRKNFYDGKGHMQARPDLAACEALIARARLIHVHLEDWCRHLLPLARLHGTLLSCDLQDVVSLDDPYRQDFIRHADILFFSTVNHPQPQHAISRLLEGQPHRLVIGGMGAQGCVLGTSQGLRFFPPLQLPEPVVDTNGAGDGLAVGFLASHVLDGLPLEESILHGQLCARFTCSQRAGPKTLLSQERLQALASQYTRP